MTERRRELDLGRTQATRRAMIASNVKAIGAIAATALVASLAKPTPAMARACFLRGTRIKTVLGEQNVEDLAIGDSLPTVFGGTRPIQWITRYRHVKDDSSKPWKRQALPVRIVDSALAPNVPHTDLYVTPGHALFIDGLLVPAGSLINGTTISLYAADEYDELEFFQIKLEAHDVIYAEGAPCESLLRVNEADSSFAEYRRACGIPEMPDRHCAPIVCNGAHSEIRSRALSAISPWLGPQKIDIIRDRLEERAVMLLSVEQLSAALPKRHHLVEGAVS